MMASKTPPHEKTGQAANTRTHGTVQQGIEARAVDYTSNGVTDNDIFLLPSSDLQLLLALTLLAAIIRLFRIYQPSSVVFDEVQ